MRPADSASGIFRSQDPDLCIPGRRILRPREPCLYDNVFVMSYVNILFTFIINIRLRGLMQANTHYYKIYHHHNIYYG